MATNYPTYDVDEITEQWERLRTVELIRDREVLIEKRRLAMMIARRDCSFREVAEKADVSRAYPGQLAERFTQGLYDRKLAALGEQVSP